MNLSTQYRPVNFDSILGQDDITHILRNQIRRSKLGNAYLFLGPSGSGKTTTARVLAMAVNCEKPKAGNPCGKCSSCIAIHRNASYDVMEFDIGSYRGIDGIKEMERMAMFWPFGKKKVYILDEVQALVSIAWEATLKMLEEAKDHMLFILCASEDKIPETARSRCQEFVFQRLEANMIAQKLAIIAHKERIELSPSSLNFIGQCACGNMRTAEMDLMQVANLNHGKPKPKQIRNFLQTKINLKENE